MGRWGLVLCVAAIACCAMPSKAQDRDSIEIGRWIGGAYGEDDGTYRFCAVTAVFPGEVDMILYWAESGFSFTLTSEIWDLPVDDTYTVSAAIDRSWTRRISGRAISDAAINFGIGHDADAVRAFRLGRRLSIETDTTILRFDLQGTNAAIEAIEACHARNLALPTAGAGGSSEGPGAGSVIESDYRRFPEPNLTLEEVRILMNEESLVLIKVMPPPDGLSHYDFVAPTSPGYVRGTYVELDPGTASTQEILTDHQAVSQLLCQGVFASGSEPPVAFGTSFVQRGFAACQTDDETLHEDFAIFLSTGAFAQIFLITSDGDGRDIALTITDTLFNTLETLAYFTADP